MVVHSGDTREYGSEGGNAIIHRRSNKRSCSALVVLNRVRNSTYQQAPTGEQGLGHESNHHHHAYPPGQPLPNNTALL